MQVTIYLEKESVGELNTESRGLYTHFFGRMKMMPLVRVQAVFESGSCDLGYPVPDQESLIIRTSMPTSRLPKGKLLHGSVFLPQDQSPWQPCDNLCMNGRVFPYCYQNGRLLRFPWRCGEALPAEDLFCFLRFVPEKEKTYIELRLDAHGNPVFPDT